MVVLGWNPEASRKSPTRLHVCICVYVMYLKVPPGALLACLHPGDRTNACRGPVAARRHHVVVRLAGVPLKSRLDGFQAIFLLAQYGSGRFGHVAAGAFQQRLQNNLKTGFEEEKQK